MFKNFVCAELQVLVFNGDKFYSTETDVNGMFSIDKLPSGKYTVSFLIELEVLSIELKGNGTINLSLRNPVVSGTGGVNTHISIKRIGKKLTGNISKDVLPEPSPIPSPTATPE